ncbi:MAG: TonB-dependent receptor, partial [Bacteroidota bacterium]
NEPPDTFSSPTILFGVPTFTDTFRYVLQSWYGRVNYTFKNRYLLTATLRADATSRFSPETRWGYFPSVALAWKIDEEEFLRSVRQFSQLKLRAGYGITGQQDGIALYPYLARYTPSETSAQYQFGGQFINTLRPEAYDRNIKWEETTTYNIGLDFGFFDDRITGSLDLYRRFTSDLLNNIRPPAGSNLGNEVVTNVGSIENQGFELTTNFDIVRREDWNVSFGFNVTRNLNTISQLTQVASDSAIGNLVGDISGGVGNTVQVHTVGFPTFSFYVLEQVYDDAGLPIEGEYVDRNGDGEVNLDDRYRFENPTPDYFLGATGNVSYKSLSLSFVVRGNIGQYVYNNVRSDRGTLRGVNNSPPFLTNMHRDVLTTRFENPQLFSDYYLEDASFVRLDNLVLSYSLPNLAKDRIRAQVSVIGQNLWVLTNYSGLDPEVANGIDNNFYPVPRTLSLGVNLSFR